MFPSSNNGNVDPIYCSNQQGYNINRPFFNDITCNSKHEDEAPLPFFHLPSSPFNTCYDEFEFFHHQNQEVILEQQQQQQPLKGIFDTSTIVDMVESVKNINNTNNELMMNRISNCSTNCKEQIPRKRCSKRDRHSKINTAQGPRDRRMRLSLKVAREFFDLQDKLCFDKASKTVEWLLIQARPAIKKLCGTTNGLQVNNYSCSIGDKSASSTSECEVVSGLIDQDDEAVAAIKCSINLCKSKSSSCVNNNKGKRVKPSRKMTFHPLARESREKARARARERTREKQKWSRRIDEANKPCEGEAAKGRESFNQLSCWSPFETGEESATQSHTMNPSSMEVEAPIISRLVTNETMIDESLAIMGKWSPSSIINHLYNSGFPQEHQITDFQSFSKPWEA